MSWGSKWDQGSASIIGSYQHKSALAGSERAVTAHPHFNTLAEFGEGDACNPGTVYSLNGGNLPGLSASQASIPRGHFRQAHARRLRGDRGQGQYMRIPYERESHSQSGSGRADGVRALSDQRFVGSLLGARILARGG